MDAHGSWFMVEWWNSTLHFCLVIKYFTSLDGNRTDNNLTICNSNLTFWLYYISNEFHVLNILQIISLLKYLIQSVITLFTFYAHNVFRSKVERTYCKNEIWKNCILSSGTQHSASTPKRRNENIMYLLRTEPTTCHVTPLYSCTTTGFFKVKYNRKLQT